MRKTATQFRILLLLASLFLVMLLAGLVWQSQNRNYVVMLRDRFQTEKQVFVGHLATLVSNPLRSYTVENSFWDEAVAFLKSNDKTWAHDSLEVSARTAHADALWVYPRSGPPLHHWSATPEIANTFQPETQSVLEELAQKRILTWFTRTSKGDVWEMHGATIHPSNDPNHQGPFFGYLIVGRRCDTTYLAYLGTLSSCRMSLSNDPPEIPQKETEIIAVSVPLMDIHHQPVAYLRGIADNPLAPAITRSTQQALILFSVFAFFVLTMTLFALFRWLGIPIALLSDALHDRDPKRLTPLMAEQTEFGDLARMIHGFFRQEKDLLAARDELEERVTERTAELSYRAYHDALTGLPNRDHFRERLHTTLAEDRQERKLSAVLFIDLDNFKVINDSLGHDVGDYFLRATAERIQSLLRPTDTIARLGGDEFAVLLGEVKSESEATTVASRLTELIPQPVVMGERRLMTTASIGVAFGNGAESPSDLLRNADMAMYRAKGNGKAGYAVFDTLMKQQADERLEMEADLRHAMLRKGEEIHIVYQPIIDLKSERLVGIEALLRWHHPKGGAVSPSRFIPVAEETGLIHDLTRWTLWASCRYRVELARIMTVPDDLYVSVNVSAACLQQAGMVALILGCVRDAGLRPAQLALEITETIMVEHLDSISQSLQELRSNGIRIMIDDFGTGYSSMSSLANLPVDAIKVDQSFVTRIDYHTETRAILQAIVALAKALRLDVVSEGIETPEQWAALLELDCGYGQGFYLSPPLSPTALEHLLTAHNAPEAAVTK